MDRRPDDTARVILLAGEKVGDTDEHAFRREVADLVSHLADSQVKDIELGRFVLEITRVAVRNGIRLAPEFAIIGKALLNLDEIARTLAPTFDPNAALRRHAVAIVQQRMRRDLSLANVFQGAIETQNLMHSLPGRLNQILGRIADNELSLNVDAIDEDRLMAGMQKVANRIAMGLVLAALIVGAAMMMDVQTSFTILGYPGLAMILFLAAAGGGFAMVVNILASDVRDRRRKRRPR
jgi:predicted unusual protein kinase regulating ubiquinone biosynthesis (AarF/ABC1/UbiB family)